MSPPDGPVAMAGRDAAPVVRLTGVSQRYRKTIALDAVSLDIPSGCMVGLIGPDGVGKSSLLSLVAGARAVQAGKVEALGGDMAEPEHRRAVCTRIAYMPQGLGRNLYATLSVAENLHFFGRLFGPGRAERQRRIADLTESTGLGPFLDRPAGKLSSGMKQKLGLCCALIHDPDLLILDEPTTGVDPLSRRQFWELIDRIRQARPGMSVVVATAYMDEAAGVAIEAQGLTMRFGDFTAVDDVSFRIEWGEIFGFPGSNVCGKSTTMKMLTGLLQPTEGQAWLFGHEVDANDLETRRRVGYMSQAFSLYRELTVRQNLELHARLFQMPEPEIPGRIAESAARFGLEDVIDTLPAALPLGQRQRLSLAVAMIHQPAMLILDEPTSGVDPVARAGFWRIMIDLARHDRVTIFISTHFMNEAEHCDRISLMHAGRVLVSDTPQALVEQRGAASLEDAFVG